MGSTDEWIIYLGTDLPLICHFFFPLQIKSQWDTCRGLRTDTMILKDGQKEGDSPTHGGGKYLQKICRGYDIRTTR